jgi:hypothetical protein
MIFQVDEVPRDIECIGAHDFEGLAESTGPFGLLGFEWCEFTVDWGPVNANVAL